ncbi:hypothetical protein T492DRAFT_956793 [Pavlovales sp. CCMP2436]|nr:hypothetical protein T492DRAFT_956793 [Pavlovales sp. CCMP2436]
MVWSADSESMSVASAKGESTLVASADCWKTRLACCANGESTLSASTDCSASTSVWCANGESTLVESGSAADSSKGCGACAAVSSIMSCGESAGDSS